MVSKSITEFLSLLKDNNNREWFQANKHLYDAAKKKFEDYINQLIAKVASIDEEIVSLNAKDCIFRIFRDVRFSHDKRPYKPNFGAYIVKGGRKSGYAGYYLHVEPEMSFVGGGVYKPQPDNLRAIRNGIFYNAEEFKKIINSKSFHSNFGELYGDKLKSAPRGFDKDFKDIDLLKHKDYTIITKVSDTLLTSKNADNKIVDSFKLMVSFNRFINEAIG